MATSLTRWRDMLAPFEAANVWFAAPEIRIEQLVEDGHYVVRAEVPGVDPGRDIDVTVEHGVLHIRAERGEEKREKAHSEFHYGRLLRSVPLPAGADEDSATARYANGILEVSFTLGEPGDSGRHVAVQVEKGTSAQPGGSRPRR